MRRTWGWPDEVVPERPDEKENRLNVGNALSQRLHLFRAWEAGLITRDEFRRKDKVLQKQLRQLYQEEKKL